MAPPPNVNHLRAAVTSVLRPHLPSPSSSSASSLVNSAQSITTKTHHQQQQQPYACCSPLYSARIPQNKTTNTAQFTQPFSTTNPTNKMSSMPATGGHSAACCNIPPVVSSGYEKKGVYETIDGKKTYVTGPTKEVSKGILVIMDVFGFFDQTIQGCDILATADDHNKYAVFMPDAFDGEPLPIDLFPPDNEDKQKKVGAFFGKNSPPSFVPKIAGILKDAQAKYPNIKEWGAVGFCWGSKVISLTASTPENPFKIGAECHPAMVDPKDAEKIKIPIAMLASKDEPAEDVKKFEAALTGPKHVEIFEDQIHGWMAARSDLSDSRVKEEYVRAYKTVLTFFANNWS